MVDSQVVEEWLKKADEDFEFAESVLEESSFYAQICFHFQQAAEKYLKSFIIANELEFKKIHDLPVLLKSCLKRDPELQNLADACKILNPFYVETRYPVHWPTEFTKEDASQAKDAAARVRNVIKATIKSKLHDGRSLPKNSPV